MIPPVLPAYARAPISFTHGKGCWLTASDGARYLDLGAGIAVNALGHAHPALARALTAQAGRLWHVSNLYEIPEQTRLAEALVAATFADTVFFTNSGSEALELAVKMARRHWHASGSGERTILTVEGAFHGRSMAAISAAGGAKMTDGFGPLLPGFMQVPFADHDALEAALDAPDLGAVLVEPIQGEGGIRPLPAACLRGLREACDARGLLLILDEVQCGMGRTGRLFAHEHAGIAPDIMMVAKGIGGGFPLGAVLATEQAASAMTAGSHGATYGGNPLASAVGSAVMEIVADASFLADVRAKADILHTGLAGLVEAHPQVFAGVRGQGLMTGLQCRVPNTDLVRAGYGEHVLTVPAGDNVVRILPPLTISTDEIAEGITRLDRAAARLSGHGG